jgi:hypothetical protein
MASQWWSNANDFAFLLRRSQQHPSTSIDKFLLQLQKVPLDAYDPKGASLRLTPSIRSFSHRYNDVYLGLGAHSSHTRERTIP